jgi:NAD(P)-dependent dehydrogenase (short-subunit alcohol dehydrogenase family)
MPFTGRVAVVTGGGGDLGGRLALALAERGAEVGLLDRDRERAEIQADSITRATNRRTVSLAADVTAADDLADAAETLRSTLGPVDLLINAAGGNHPDATTSLEQIGTDARLDDGFFGLSPDAFRTTLDLNLMGTVLPSQSFARDMSERCGGAILNISSMNALRPLTRIPAYAAAKCAVSNFTQWLAVHLAPRGVRVNALAPGFFITEQLRYLAYDAHGELTPRYRRVIEQTPMHRFGEADDLTGAAMFLLDDSAGFVTGVTLPIDGGFSSFGQV